MIKSDIIRINHLSFNKHDMKIIKKILISTVIETIDYGLISEAVSSIDDIGLISESISSTDDFGNII